MSTDTPSPIQLVNRGGRACLLLDGRCIDVAERSRGTLSSDPMVLLADFDPFCTWAAEVRARPGDPKLELDELGPCVPRPLQVFGIGLNYRAHAQEAGIPIPTAPMVFTKFPSCVSGPTAPIRLTGERVDWEVELVVVIGTGGSDISEEAALSHVAGYCVGQDISDRRLQFGTKPPQFSLGKSAPGFGPIGPAVVAMRSIPTPLDLALSCDINGERMQDSRTSDMIFSVPTLIAYLSARCALCPGDLIFTGTPSGVGSVRNPRVYLKDGDEIRTEIEGLGVMVNRCSG